MKEAWRASLCESEETGSEGKEGKRGGRCHACGRRGSAPRVTQRALTSRAGRRCRCSTFVASRSRPLGERALAAKPSSKRRRGGRRTRSTWRAAFIARIGLTVPVGRSRSPQKVSRARYAACVAVLDEFSAQTDEGRRGGRRDQGRTGSGWSTAPSQRALTERLISFAARRSSAPLSVVVQPLRAPPR